MNLYDLYKKYKKEYNRLKKADTNGTDRTVSLYDKRIGTFDAIITSNSLNDRDCSILYEHKKEGVVNSKKYKYVTKAGQGTIFFIFFDSYGVALKFIEIPSFFLERGNLYNPIHKKWRELYVLKECTKLVRDKVTQNLPMVYGDRLCKRGSDSMLLLYSELADGDLSAWLRREHSSKDWKDMLYQVWHSVYVLQKRLKLIHNDLRLGNVLFFRDEYPSGYKYIMDNDAYYLNEPKYIFVVWDFGSSELLDFAGNFKNSVKNKLEANNDLHFIHDLYKRLRVLALTNRYTISELEDVLSKNVTDIEYVRLTKEDNRKKFSDKRFDEKYQISLAYYIMETGRFDKLYQDRKDTILPGYEKVYLPPKDIDEILKTLSEKYNYKYSEALSKYGPTSRRIPNPKKLIDIFLPEYKESKSYTITFTS